jgi:hypothetical protein
MIYGVIHPMKAQEIFRVKQAYGSGFVEVVIWQVLEPVPPCEHPHKYRLVYVVNGQRLLGYDNERGKGDHKHIGGGESPYSFVNPQQLMADFMADLKEFIHD